MNYIVNYSGGFSSWQAAERVAAKYGTSRLTLLFCDTLMEDEDLYRFLIESAAHVYGIPVESVSDLAAQALAVTPIETNDLPKRKRELAALRQETVDRIRGLVWLVDGRTPWELCHQQRFIANSRVDFCSHVLKREISKRWYKKNCRPESSIRVYGFNHEEDDRAKNLAEAISPWTAAFPLMEKPYIFQGDYEGVCQAAGVPLPRLYRMGFWHNNCGGFCFKAGQKAIQVLLKEMPDRYAYHEGKEEGVRQYLGKNVSVLQDRKGGKPKTLTLAQFRTRGEGQRDNDDWGSCSCFYNPEEMKKSARRLQEVIGIAGDFS